MFPRRNVPPLSREVVAGIRESSPSDRHNLAVSYRDNQAQLMKNNYGNYLSRANTSLHGIAGMLLKLIWKVYIFLSFAVCLSALEETWQWSHSSLARAGCCGRYLEDVSAEGSQVADGGDGEGLRVEEAAAAAQSSARGHPDLHPCWW